MPRNELSETERVRYGRHIVLPEVGVAGQQKLRDASVLVIGAGGLGSPVGLYLAAAGIGRIGIVDFDRVDRSNLQRQILFDDRDVGRPKVEAAAARLREANPHTEVVPYDTALGVENAIALFEQHDVIIDGSDNFATRYLVNDACVFARRPDVYGSVHRFEGQLSVFCTDGGPCYRCLFPEPPPPDQIPNCAEGGVLGVLPGTIGTWQATEAIKLILGAGDVTTGRLLHYDALAMRIHTFKVPKDPQCPVCGEHPSITTLAQTVERCGAPPAARSEVVTPAALRRRLSMAEPPPYLIDVRSEADFALQHIDGSRSIPSAALPEAIGTIPQEADVIVICKMGVRSQPAATFLRSEGFARVAYLTGGLDAWNALDSECPT